jgi:cation diffusion facilitator family transporter
MKKFSSNNVKRILSTIYVDHDEEHQPLTFSSHKVRESDISNEKNHTNSFIYNDEEDIYKIRTKKSSEFSNVQKNANNIYEDSIIKNSSTHLYSQIDINNEEEEEKNILNGNIIFANLININYKQEKLTPLYIIIFCYLLFSAAEIICGYYSSSLTLMADAAHYFSESCCFCIYIVSIYVSRKSATNTMSFGFHRGEMISVLVRATLLLGFSFWLIYYIVFNFIYPKNVNGLIIIILGIISTFFNLIMGLVLMFIGISNDITFSEKEKICVHQHENNGLNCYSIQRTFTNVIFNSIQSCIIILAGVILYFLPFIKYIDPLCTLLLTCILLYHAYNHMEGVITVLMEGSPLEFDVEGLEKNLLSLEGVIEVHDIHVWSLSIGKISMSCHLTTNEPQKSLVLARDLIKKKYGITHSTIQVELNKVNKKQCKSS